MNNEKLNQIRESIANTVSSIESANGNFFANAVLVGHLKTLTAMEAALLGTIAAPEASSRLDVPKPPEPPSGGLSQAC